MAPQLASAVSLGSCIAGVPVTLHYSFFVLLLFEFIYSIRLVGTYPGYMLFVVLFYGPVVLATILVHEFGHALTAKRLGATVGGIVLWPLGGFAICGPSDSLVGDLKVALAGPATHVPMGFFWWLVYAGATGGKDGWWPSSTIYYAVISSSVAGFVKVLAAQGVYLNIVLLCFNLFIPAYPLDGGRIYAASLMLVFKLGGRSAAKVTAVTAMLISTGMIVYAAIAWYLFPSGGEVLLGLIGAYIFYTSYELFKSAQRNDLGDHPIFGRECYKGNGRNSTSCNVGGTGTTGTTVPAQTEDAVIA